MTDIFAPVSSSAIGGCYCTVTWCIVHTPCMKPSLLNMVASAPNKSDMGSVKLEHCLNKFITSPSLVVLCVGTSLPILFSFFITVQIISFMEAPGDFRSLVVFSGFFFRPYLCPFSQECTQCCWYINDMSSPDIIHSEAWNDKAPKEKILLLWIFGGLCILL